MSTVYPCKNNSQTFRDPTSQKGVRAAWSFMVDDQAKGDALGKRVKRLLQEYASVRIKEPVHIKYEADQWGRIENVVWVEITLFLETGRENVDWDNIMNSATACLLCHVGEDAFQTVDLTVAGKKVHLYPKDFRNCTVAIPWCCFM